jgi:copper chaperone NosL
MTMTDAAKTRGADGHVHLAVVDSASAEAEGGGKPAWDWARGPVLGAGAAAVAFFAASFFVPWWTFALYAPQYPKGLTLVISLTGMGGDVSEIDLLNHYIGMKHLAGAAPVERHLAGYGVALIAVLTLVMLAASGKKLNKLVALPAIGFPVGFLADSFYWLYTFGHQLDPKAPLRIGAFTPEMFGNGQIGQFETFASPAVGFWLAIAGVAFALLATFLRSRVCAHCKHAGTCSAVCPRLMVLPERKAS